MPLQGRFVQPERAAFPLANTFTGCNLESRNPHHSFTAPQSHNGGMMRLSILDLVPSYLHHVVDKGNEAAYYATYPALFEHLLRYWDGDGFPAYEATTLYRRAAAIKAALTPLARRWRQQGVDDALDVVLLAWKGTSNGHAFRDEARGRTVVWLPVEGYPSPLRVRVFVTHEMAHALHYHRRPEFYFRDEAARCQVGRQLLTEGVATLLSACLWALEPLTALWADFLPREEGTRWLRRCQAAEGEMAAFALQRWASHEADNAFFSLQDEEDVLRYRGGYYLALRLLARIAAEHQMSALTLLDVPRERLEGWARTTLSHFLPEKGREGA